jgi:hypothetical protein
VALALISLPLLFLGANPVRGSRPWLVATLVLAPVSSLCRSPRRRRLPSTTRVVQLPLLGH